jgi:hypothetical protein
MIHRFGFIVFLLELQRLSGESVTSVSNGMINAFVMWIAQGKPSLENFLGFFEGDDGLVPRIPGVNYVKTATAYGFDLTLNTHFCMFTANYCGRFLTHNGSMCDFMRTVSKFHLSSNTSQSRESLLLAKSLSYLSTDYNTPVIGAMCWAFVQRLRGTKANYSHDNQRRLRLSGVHIPSLYDLPAPEFDRTIAYQITWIADISFKTLQSLHQAWLLYGRGYSPYFSIIENPLCSNALSIVEVLE